MNILESFMFRFFPSKWYGLNAKGFYLHLDSIALRTISLSPLEHATIICCISVKPLHFFFIHALYLLIHNGITSQLRLIYSKPLMFIYFHTHLSLTMSPVDPVHYFIVLLSFMSIKGANARGFYLLLYSIALRTLSLLPLGPILLIYILLLIWEMNFWC